MFEPLIQQVGLYGIAGTLFLLVSGIAMRIQWPVIVFVCLVYLFAAIGVIMGLVRNQHND